jgi:hypothetical protein
MGTNCIVDLEKKMLLMELVEWCHKNKVALLIIKWTVVYSKDSDGCSK